MPSLVFFLGFSTVEAIATTFPFTAAVKLAGFAQHSKQGTFHYRVGAALLLGGVPGAVVGVALLSRLFAEYGDSLEVWVNLFIGLLVLIGAALLVVQIRLKRRSVEQEGNGLGPKKWLAGSGVGGVLGLIMGATSVGAGTLMTAPVLLIFRISCRQGSGYDDWGVAGADGNRDAWLSEPGPSGLEYGPVPEYRSGACGDSR